ncbi:hypothetical protein CPBF367_41120 [Xanthomonas arboricola pv. juglandis]|nr:hypothetical protein [Xanthomonas euroxanthea]SYZ57829.1 hypothetical protein CPBF367_41120 [Xanthomonas arboricola pv. juglandis]
MLAKLSFDAGDPDFEEFIQIGADDADETQAFQQGRARIFGLRQYPFLESQRGKIAVQEQFFSAGLRAAICATLGRGGATRAASTYFCFSMMTQLWQCVDFL